MPIQHAKSPCCREIIYRYGSRRRQCSSCGVTWRIRHKERGRKARRIPSSLLVKVLIHKESLTRVARRARCSVPAMRKRFRCALIQLVKAPTHMSLPRGSLTLLGDGMWIRFNRERRVLYLLAVKSPRKARAYFLDPVLLSGKESGIHWEQAIATIPETVLVRINSLVSDGFRGGKRIARTHGWVMQRCHFHLIAQLQIRRGRIKYRLQGRRLRETIYHSIREALITSDPHLLRTLLGRLTRLSDHPDCPRKLRMIVREFVREIDAFRAYRIHPNLQLPTTTNTVECMVKLIRIRVRPLSTPKALLAWSTAYIRLQRSLTCNGSKFQPN